MKMILSESDKMSRAIKYDVEIYGTGIINHITTIIFKQLIDTHTIQPKSDKEYYALKRHLNCVLTNLIVAYLYGKHHGYVGYQRNNNWYEYRNSRYNGNNIKLKYLKIIIDGLTTLDYINHKLGFKDWRNQKSVCGSQCSKMRLTDHHTKIIESAGESECLSNIHHITSECIRLKSSKNKITGHARLVDYDDNKNINEMRTILLRYNDFINTQSITHPIYNSHTQNHFIYRVFNNDTWEQGGRFYNGFWQNIPTEDRKDILINGNAVTELDFKSYHPSILYHLTGADMKDDPYQLNDISRDIGKIAFNILINANDRANAIKGIHFKSYVDKEITLPTDCTPTTLIDLLCTKHKKISHYFFTAIGNTLQYRDSKIAERIINYFTQKNLVVLPIHDSFIVEKHNTTTLKRSMALESEKELGFKPCISLKF